MSQVKHLGEEKMLKQLESKASSSLEEFDARALAQLLKAFLDLDQNEFVSLSRGVSTTVCIFSISIRY